MAFSEVSEDIDLVPSMGVALSLNADEDVTAGQGVETGSDLSCEPSDTDGEQATGVTTQTISSGDQTHVASVGSRVKFTAGTGNISAGDQLASHGGTGEEGQVDTATSGDNIIGIALEGSSAQGDLVEGVVINGGQPN